MEVFVLFTELQNPHQEESGLFLVLLGINDAVQKQLCNLFVQQKAVGWEKKCQNVLFDHTVVYNLREQLFEC